MWALPPPSQVAPGSTGFSSQVAPGSQLPDCCRSWLELQTLKPNSFLKYFCTLCATLCAGPLISQDLDRRAGSKRAHKGGGVRSPMRRALISKDLDRRVASKRAQKRVGGCAQPYARDTIFPRFGSWRRLRKGHITNIIFHMRNYIFLRTKQNSQVVFAMTAL